MMVGPSAALLYNTLKSSTSCAPNPMCIQLFNIHTRMVDYSLILY